MPPRSRRGGNARKFTWKSGNGGEGPGSCGREAAAGKRHKPSGAGRLSGVPRCHRPVRGADFGVGVTGLRGKRVLPGPADSRGHGRAPAGVGWATRPSLWKTPPSHPTQHTRGHRGACGCTQTRRTGDAPALRGESTREHAGHAHASPGTATPARTVCTGPYRAVPSRSSRSHPSAVRRETEPAAPQSAAGRGGARRWPRPSQYRMNGRAPPRPS